MRCDLRSAAAMLVWALAFAAPAARADAPAPPGAARDAVVAGGARGIFGELPRDCVVHAVGTYHGTADVKDAVELDRSGHRVRQAEVVVNVPDRPVVLVLTAYDPTVWRVGRTAETRLVGVVVSGYHGQALIGIDRRTPHAISSHEKKGGPFRFFYAYSASPQLLAMNEAVKGLVGREIDHFENAPAGGVFSVGEPPKGAAAVLYSADLKVSDYAEPAQAHGQPAPLPAGAKGIDQLVLDGKLRPATPADIEAWVDEASEKYKRFNVRLRVETRMRPGRTYVVLGETTLPDGMFGAQSRAFIIPTGVPFPAGPKSHNQFYRMDGTEEGPQAPGQ